MAGLLGLVHVGTGLLVLAGLPQERMNCTVPEAPQIRVNAASSDIRYDFTRSSATLSGIGGQALESGPYADRTDVMTGGLRADEPKLQTKFLIGTMSRPDLNQACLHYKSIDVQLQLSPVIYIARENSYDGPCRDAVLAHERRHVKVDHEVMNRFATKLGAAIQTTVNEVGPVGPVRADAVEAYQKEMEDRITRITELNINAMKAEMQAQQALVDSRAEYDRISAICQADPNAVRARQK